MPRQAAIVGAQEIGIVEYELPELGEGQVRVRSEFGAAKHGTDMALFKGYGGGRGSFDGELQLYRKPERADGAEPGVPGLGWAVGNMFVGKVIDVGIGVPDVGEGDTVLGYGPFREVHTVDAAACWKMPEGVARESAVCLDPADFAMSAVRDGNVRVGDAVAVFGMGAIGLMVVQIARLSGASPVIAVEPLANRRAAAEACGADLVLDPTACDVGVEVKTATGKRGVDVAIEYSGSVHAMHQAIRSTAFGGNVVAGSYPPPYGPGLDFGAEGHLNIPNIIFSRACSEPGRDHPRWTEKRIYATCWRLICEGKLTGEPIVDPIVAFEDLVTEYPKIATDPGSSIKLAATF